MVRRLSDFRKDARRSAAVPRSPDWRRFRGSASTPRTLPHHILVTPSKGSHSGIGSLSTSSSQQPPSSRRLILLLRAEVYFAWRLLRPRLIRPEKACRMVRRSNTRGWGVLTCETGWIAQWDPNYEKWFYVNENSNNKTPTWDHPKGTTPFSTFGGQLESKG